MARVYIRTPDGKFARKGYSGNVMFFVKEQKLAIRGYNKAKNLILEKQVEFKRPILVTSEIEKVASQADSVRFFDVHGRIITGSHTGKVKVMYFKKGKRIGTFEIDGLSDKKRKLFDSKSIEKPVIFKVTLTNRDGARLFPALESKGIDFRGYKGFRIKVQYTGKAPFFVDVDFSKQPERWNRTYYISYLIREKMTFFKSRFSGKASLRGIAIRKLRKIPKVILTFQRR